jgi:CBS domain containing-hemolysin-like protein
LVFLNGFFVASEFSIVKVRATRIQELISRGKRRATQAGKVVSNMDEYLSATQLGITLASLGLGWIGEPAFAALFEPIFAGLGFLTPVLTHSLSAAVAFMLITFLHIVLGELAPKSLAIQLPEPVVLATAGPMILFYKLSYPFIWSLNSTAILFLRLFGIQPAGEMESAHSEEELRMILAHSHEKGVLDLEEQRILERVFDFGDRSARQIMIPAGEVVYLDTEMSFKENLEKAIKNRHTRYPLCEGSLDKVKGTIHVKDLFCHLKELGPDFDLTSIKRPVHFVPESLLIHSLLSDLRKDRIHLAIVVDEFGSTVGAVTMEDILEELVGEIQDEFDSEVPAPMIKEESSKRYLVQGRALLDDLEPVLGVEFHDEENDTIAGHVMMCLGRTARVGDEVSLSDAYRVRVLKMRNLQITQLSIDRIVED